MHTAHCLWPTNPVSVRHWFCTTINITEKMLLLFSRHMVYVPTGLLALVALSCYSFKNQSSRLLEAGLLLYLLKDVIDLFLIAYVCVCGCMHGCLCV